jgi:hypothetical protein
MEPVVEPSGALKVTGLNFRWVEGLGALGGVQTGGTGVELPFPFPFFKGASEGRTDSASAFAPGDQTPGTTKIKDAFIMYRVESLRLTNTLTVM